jgi:DNA mismatch endonuclease (patch repair protein)
MTDTFTRSARSEIMRRVRSNDTTPELRARRVLHAAGFRYQLHRRDLPGTPDLVLPRFRIVVFVHGCFWHWHGCKRSRMPAANRDYWERKISRNRQRDQTNVKSLRKSGWRCRILWECKLERGLKQLVRELQRERRAAGPPVAGTRRKFSFIGIASPGSPRRPE